MLDFSNDRIYFHVGTLKTGTTTIQKVLELDPRIEISIHSRWYNTGKFSERPDELFEQSNALAHVESDENIARKIRDKVGLEKSLKRIKLDYPDAKLIYTIRDQFSALDSMYKHFIRHTYSSMSYSQFLKSDYGQSYLETLYYDKVYKTMMKYFEPENIHFFDTNILFNDSEKFFESFYARLFNIKPYKVDDVVENIGFNEIDASVKKVINSLFFWKDDQVLSPRELKVMNQLTRVSRRIARVRPVKKVKELEEANTLKERFVESNNFLRSIYGDDFLSEAYF